MTATRRGDGISLRDRTDLFNEPSAFTQNIRGLKKGWEALSEAFSDEMTMNQACDILDGYKLKTHIYCAID